MKKMKNLRRYICLSVFAAAFLSFGLIGNVISAQTKTAAQPTSQKSKPTPKTTPKPASKNVSKPKPAVKNTPKPTGKPVAVKTPAKTAASTVKIKPTPTPLKTSVKPAPAPKPKESAQIIVSSTSSRIRSDPSTTAETLQTAKLGTIFPLLEQNAGWYKVALDKDDTEKTGWISKTVAQSFSSAKRAAIYRKIADKYLKNPTDFASTVQVYTFLGTAADDLKTPAQAAELEFKRLIALQSALKLIPVDKKEQNPYAEFLKTNEKETVYSEPSAQLLVVSRQFWELQDKYKTLPIGEEIAWRGAQNPLPGECEGYINCYLYLIRSTDAEYLNFYPNGRYSRQALKNITNLLEPIAADTKENAVYVAASDISDRADFNRFLTEIRAIVSKTTYIEKAKTLTLVKQIGDAQR